MSSNQNYILVSLMDINMEKISSQLAKKLNYYYLNIEELIDYQLIDKEKMIDVCGIEYTEKARNKVIKSINTYENSIISMNYETFSSYHSGINRNNKIIYLKVRKEQIKKEYDRLNKEIKTERMPKDKSILVSNLGISLMVYEERDKFIRKNCDYEVKCDISNIEKTISEILKILEVRS